MRSVLIRSGRDMICIPIARETSYHGSSSGTPFSLSRIQQSHSVRKVSKNANANNIQLHCMCCAPVLHFQTNNWNYSLAEDEASLVSMHKVRDFMYANFNLNPLTPQRHPSRLSIIMCKTDIYCLHRTSCPRQPALRLTALDLNLDPGNLGLICRFGSSDYEAKSH